MSKVDVKEAAIILGVVPSTVAKMIKDGKLKPSKVKSLRGNGFKYLINKKDVERFVLKDQKGNKIKGNQEVPNSNQGIDIRLSTAHHLLRTATILLEGMLNENK